MKNEIYLNINDYIGLYQISNFGNTKSLLKIRPCGKHKFVDRIYEEKLLKNFTDKRGYVYVTLTKDGVNKKYLLHRLIAETFIENKNNLPYVNHINGIKNDNRIENLEWVSARENNCHYSNLRKLKTSKYVGVNFDLRSKKWRSQITLNKNKIHLGYFLTEEEAYQQRINFELKNNIINKYN
jgi:hypothetical protein